MNTFDSIMARVNATKDRNHKELEALAALTGQTVAQVEADVCAPDPGIGEAEQERWRRWHEAMGQAQDGDGPDDGRREA